MGKTFSCDLPSCDFICTKQSELKKHSVEHRDPSKLHHCTQCSFTTLHKRNLIDHQNIHDNLRPNKCNEIVDGKLCKFSSNYLSALYKHRKDKHQHESGSKPQAGASYEHTSPAPPSRVESSYPQTLHSTTTPAHASDVTRPPASIEHPFSNDHPSASNRYCGQNIHPCTTVPMPSPMFVDSKDNAIVTSNSASSTPPPMLPYTPTSNAESTSLGPVVSHNNSHYNSVPRSASSYSALPTSPAEVPFHNALSNYTHPVRGEGFNNRTNAFAQGPMAVNPGLSSHNFVNRDVSATLPSLHNRAMVSNRAKTLAQMAILNSALSSQYNFADRRASATLPLHNRATASSRNSFYTPNINSTQTPPRSRYSSLSGALGAESPLSASVTSSHPADSSLSPESSIDFSPSPSAEPVTPQDDESKDDRYVSTSAVEPTDMGASVTPHDSCASRDVILPAPPSSCVLSVPQEALDDDHDDDSAGDLTKYLPSQLPAIEFHEDEIFYRGTGREGCLCPEMMVDAGIEGWDKSVLDSCA